MNLKEKLIKYNLLSNNDKIIKVMNLLKELKDYNNDIKYVYNNIKNIKNINIKFIDEIYKTIQEAISYQNKINIEKNNNNLKKIKNELKNKLKKEKEEYLKEQKELEKLITL